MEGKLQRATLEEIVVPTAIASPGAAQIITTPAASHLSEGTSLPSFASVVSAMGVPSQTAKSSESIAVASKAGTSEANRLHPSPSGVESKQSVPSKEPQSLASPANQDTVPARGTRPAPPASQPPVPPYAFQSDASPQDPAAAAALHTARADVVGTIASTNQAKTTIATPSATPEKKDTRKSSATPVGREASADVAQVDLSATTIIAVAPVVSAQDQPSGKGSPDKGLADASDGTGLKPGANPSMAPPARSTLLSKYPGGVTPVAGASTSATNVAAGESIPTTPAASPTPAAALASQSSSVTVASTASLIAPAASVTRSAISPAVPAPQAHAQHGSSSAELQISSYEATTPNRLEVGVSGGSVGWLNVRAELSRDGGVHALLRAPQAAATQLRNQATDIASFLSDNAVSVREVVVETMPAPAVGHVTTFIAESARGFSADAQEQRHSSRQQGSGRTQTDRSAVANDREMESLSVPLSTLTRSGPALATTGGWLSVRV